MRGKLSKLEQGTLAKQLRHATKLVIKRSPLAAFVNWMAGRRRPLYQSRRMGREAGWTQAAIRLLSPEGRDEREDPLLLADLVNDINRDIETEFLLTAARRRLLLGSRELMDDQSVQKFVCVLIQQCINNEYVWFVSREEAMVVLALTRRLEEMKEFEWQTVALLAMYGSLSEVLNRCAERIGHEAIFDQLPGDLRGVAEGVVVTHNDEQALKESIECFRPIDEATSQIVGNMYEEYPYPRWFEQRLSPQVPGSRQTMLEEFFDKEQLSFLDRPFNVLVAGCGTGAKAIQIAQGYGESARVLGIDLSRASLAYASRMARLLSVGNVEFMQMDIYDLPRFGRLFDVIECTGVLVCVAEPLKAWNVLVDRLRPTGLMHVSLYSELARREIVRLREDYEARIGSITADDIRAYRMKLMAEAPDTVEALPTMGDFFDLSRCKDLLFHPVEHRFTIPQIRELLDTLGLEFGGFERPRLIEGQYWTPYPSRRELRDLDRWWEFEQENPDAFSDLYEMWCRKIRD